MAAKPLPRLSELILKIIAFIVMIETAGNLLKPHHIMDSESQFSI